MFYTKYGRHSFRGTFQILCGHPKQYTNCGQASTCIWVTWHHDHQSMVLIVPSGWQPLMYNPLSICKIILRTHSRNSSLVCWLCTQREDTLHPSYIWDAILVSTSVGQLLRKHPVINSGIDYLPAGFLFKTRMEDNLPTLYISF